jgi:hypothetical protein
MPMNDDRSIRAGILLDRILIDAFERKFPGIRLFGLVETSIAKKVYGRCQTIRTQSKPLPARDTTLSRFPVLGVLDSHR